MSLPNAVQGEFGRTILITAYKRGTSIVQDLTGLTMTGIIESTPGPSFTTRAIVGTLAVVNPGTNGQFTWAYDEDDTETAGQFTVQFVGADNSTVVYKSFPEPWEVVRSPVVAVV